MRKRRKKGRSKDECLLSEQGLMANGRTSRRSSNKDTSDTFVDTLEAPALKEAFLRLQSSLEGVYREEQQIDREPGERASLDESG